jgi:hypothetical protein
VIQKSANDDDDDDDNNNNNIHGDRMVKIFQTGDEHSAKQQTAS